VPRSGRRTPRGNDKAVPAYAVPFAHQVTYGEDMLRRAGLDRSVNPGRRSVALRRKPARHHSRPVLATGADVRRAGADDKDVCGVSVVTASFLRCDLLQTSRAAKRAAVYEATATSSTTKPTVSLVALTGRDPVASDRPRDRGNGEQPSIGQSRWVSHRAARSARRRC
jgi:hypothetical protein